MDKTLLEFLVCPICKGKLILRDHELWCRADKLAYAIKDDIPVMIAEKARALADDELEAQ